MGLKLPRYMKSHTILLSTLRPAISTNVTSEQLQYCTWLTVAVDKGICQ